MAGIGLNLYRGPHWALSAALSADLARRKEADDPRLTGLGDVERTASAGLGARYTYDWFTVRARVATDILGRDQGTLARLDLSGRYRASDRLSFSAGPGLTWANDRYMRTFFGVDAVQSARSGLAQFEAKSGLERARFSASAGYRLARRWDLRAFASYSKLRNDAAASPITEDRSQYVIGAFVTYRFGDTPAFREESALP